MDEMQAIEALLGRYLAACESRNVEAIATCFASSAIVSDPTSPVTRGRTAIATYFRSLYDDLDALKLQTSQLYWRGTSVACQWRGEARRKDGKTITYEGIDVFELDANPLIARMDAYWDPKDFKMTIR